MNTYIFLYLVISILFSAFFSGMEIAFVSVDRLRLRLDKKSLFTSKILNVFFRSPDNFISTMLVGNNIVLVVYGVLMAKVVNYYIFGGRPDDFGTVSVETILSTLIILVTGEFLPKSIFKINPSAMLRTFAIPLYICYIILYPISKFSSEISYLFFRIFGMKVNKETKAKAFGKVDLDYFIQSSIDNSQDEEDLDTEVKIFQNALDFSNIKIRDCIVPRTEIVGVDKNTVTLDELKTVFIESGISKVIIYDGNIDNVVGYIHSSEMFRDADDWHNCIKTLPIVPETMAAHKLMKLFMQQKKFIAVVVDEFGGTSGIVTLEDLVEEIFGDIEDEHDTSTYICKQISDNEYVLSARMEIEKVNEIFALDLPTSEDYLTIGGLILNEYQSFPKLHEVIIIGSFEFKILKNSLTRIELVRLKVND